MKYDYKILILLMFTIDSFLIEFILLKLGEE